MVGSLIRGQLGASRTRSASGDNWGQCLNSFAFEFQPRVPIAKMSAMMMRIDLLMHV